MTFSDAKEFTIKSNNISATVSACDGTLKVILSRFSLELSSLSLA